MLDSTRHNRTLPVFRESAAQLHQRTRLSVCIRCYNRYNAHTRYMEKRDCANHCTHCLATQLGLAVFTSARPAHATRLANGNAIACKYCNRARFDMDGRVIDHGFVDSGMLANAQHAVTDNENKLEARSQLTNTVPAQVSTHRY
eukprot:Opistho-2@77901